MARPRRYLSFVFEATQACNHDCLHCYNAWKGPTGYPAVSPLGTADTLDMLDRMLDGTGARLVSLSGGEPLLRGDIFEIVDHLAARGVGVNLITNGSLLDEAAIGRLVPNKVSIFELPLLSVERAIHDRMCGVDGAFDRVTMAIAELKAAGQRVVCVFVATRLNLATWAETAELAFALGADGIMFNRFNPGGAGARHVELLQASPGELCAALDEAQRISGQYGMPISCSIAMPPCLFGADGGRTGPGERWPKLSFGFCAAGTERAYYTLDPAGNVRPCNHSATILGNIRRADFGEMAESAAMNDFVAARPAMCGGCRWEAQCQGGCKAAAEVCRGAPWSADPFLEAFGQRAGTG